MVITEVRIKLMEDNNENERLQAFCSVTFDDAFVVRDLKIIEGTKGSFVAMPSRKLTDRCPGCGSKNHLRARFCNACGGKLDEDRATRDADGRVKLHADIAHPINCGMPRNHPDAPFSRRFRKKRNSPSSPATSAPTTISMAITTRRWAKRPATTGQCAATARTVPTRCAASMCARKPPSAKRKATAASELGFCNRFALLRACRRGPTHADMAHFPLRTSLRRRLAAFIPYAEDVSCCAVSCWPCASWLSSVARL